MTENLHTLLGVDLLKRIRMVVDLAKGKASLSIGKEKVDVTLKQEQDVNEIFEWLDVICSLFPEELSFTKPVIKSIDLKIENILAKFPSITKGIGRTTLIQHKIELKPNAVTLRPPFFIS